MARRKSAKSAEATGEAQVISLTQPGGLPSVAAAPAPIAAGWTPPSPKPAAPMFAAPAVPPVDLTSPESEKPAVRVEAIRGANGRPTYKVSGYEDTVEAYVKRQVQLDALEEEQEREKKWFRETSKQLRTQLEAETISYPSSRGSVSVVFTRVRRKLDEASSSQVEQSGLGTLLVKGEELSVDPQWTSWLLDNSYVQDTNGQPHTLREAIVAGLGGGSVKVKAIAMLREDFAEVAPKAKQQRPDLAEAITQLEDVGYNAPTVKCQR